MLELRCELGMPQEPGLARAMPQLRSRAKGSIPVDSAKQNNKELKPLCFAIPASPPREPITILDKPNLRGPNLQLLRKKQRRLRERIPQIEKYARDRGLPAAKALASTLIFAHYEAGTAVCVDAQGWILTCAHCFGETVEEWKAERRKWLLFYTGVAVEVECREWDARRDLALAKIVCVERINQSIPLGSSPIFSFVFLALSQIPGSPIFCIGQPGADDLESDTPCKTTYDLFEISEGSLCGLVPGRDPQDNSEIGSLKHNAWTYWGHSGAPLLSMSGALVGLHSSWDDKTAMRHGIPLVAIRSFLEEKLPASIVHTDEARPQSVEQEIIVIDSD